MCPRAAADDGPSPWRRANVFIDRLPHDQWQVLNRGAHAGHITCAADERNLVQLRRTAQSRGAARVSVAVTSTPTNGNCD